jgi:clan AA aspartic protease (TIGR02281 family)
MPSAVAASNGDRADNGDKKVERKDKLLIGWAIALGVIAGSMVPMYKGPQAHTDGWAEFRVHPTPIYVNANGYFYPKITINGIPIRLIVDTGATSVALSTEDARKIGINPQTLQPTHESSTPNGMLQTTEIILPEMIVEGIVGTSKNSSRQLPTNLTR